MLADEHGELLPALRPDVVVDAIIAKRNVAGTTARWLPAPLPRPGFEAGVDQDAVIETQRGHHLGRVITQWQRGTEYRYSGQYQRQNHRTRVFAHPHSGMMTPCVNIGDPVHEGMWIARIA